MISFKARAQADSDRSQLERRGACSHGQPEWNWSFKLADRDTYPELEIEMCQVLPAGGHRKVDRDSPAGRRSAPPPGPGQVPVRPKMTRKGRSSELAL